MAENKWFSHVHGRVKKSQYIEAQGCVFGNSWFKMSLYGSFSHYFKNMPWKHLRQTHLTLLVLPLLLFPFHIIGSQFCPASTLWIQVSCPLYLKLFISFHTCRQCWHGHPMVSQGSEWNNHVMNLENSDC